MKALVVKIKNEFKPSTIQLTIENKDELITLKSGYPYADTIKGGFTKKEAEVFSETLYEIHKALQEL